MSQIYNFTYGEGDGWENCGGIPWKWDEPDPSNIALNRMISGPIENYGFSRLCRQITGPAVIRFRWQINAPPSKGRLLFLVDGWRVDSFSWQNKNNSFSIRDEGNHTVEWRFEKIEKEPEWQFFGAIDDVEISRNVCSSCGREANGGRIVLSGELIPQQNDYANGKKPKKANEIPGPTKPNVTISTNPDKCQGMSSCVTVGLEKSKYNYTSIQKAIDSFDESGGTVCIVDGQYNEDIKINKPIRLIGVNNPEITSRGEVAILIDYSDVEICYLNITSSACIYSKPSGSIKNISIHHNNMTVLFGSPGVNLTGVHLEGSNNNLIENIEVTNNTFYAKGMHSGCEINAKVVCKAGINILYSKDYKVVSNKIYGGDDTRYGKFCKGIYLNNISDLNEIGNVTNNNISKTGVGYRVEFVNFNDTLYCSIRNQLKIKNPDCIPCDIGHVWSSGLPTDRFPPFKCTEVQ